MFNQREVFRGAEIRALVHTMCHGESDGTRFHWFLLISIDFHELKTIENQWFLCDRAWIFMDFPNQLQLVATLSPISGRV